MMKQWDQKKGVKFWSEDKPELTFLHFPLLALYLRGMLQPEIGETLSQTPNKQLA